MLTERQEGRNRLNRSATARIKRAFMLLPQGVESYFRFSTIYKTAAYYKA
jgi:hypothetical protein